LDNIRSKASKGQRSRSRSDQRSENGQKRGGMYDGSSLSSV